MSASVTRQTAGVCYGGRIEVDVSGELRRSPVGRPSGKHVVFRGRSQLHRFARPDRLDIDVALGIAATPLGAAGPGERNPAAVGRDRSVVFISRETGHWDHAGISVLGAGGKGQNSLPWFGDKGV